MGDKTEKSDKTKETSQRDTNHDKLIGMNFNDLTSQSPCGATVGHSFTNPDVVGSSPTENSFQIVIEFILHGRSFSVGGRRRTSAIAAKTGLQRRQECCINAN